MTTNQRAALSLTGFGLGSFVAFAISWQQNHSLAWGLVHAVYSWFYVVYYVLVTHGVLPPFSLG